MSKQNQQLQQRPNRVLGAARPSLELQHLWFQAARQRSWQTLSIIPAHDSIRVLPLALGIGQTAAQQPGTRVLVVNAALHQQYGSQPKQPAAKQETPWAKVAPAPGYAGVDLIDLASVGPQAADRALAAAPELLSFLHEQGMQYDTTIFAVDSLIQHPGAIPVVRSTDASMLAIGLGATTFADTGRIVEIVGRDKILGAVAVHVGKQRKKPKNGKLARRK